MKPMFKEGEPESVSITLPSGALGGWSVLLRSLEIAKEKTSLDLVFGGLIEQVESQLPKPQPEEPTGLGAVVEDRDGARWVLNERSGRDGLGTLWWQRPGVSTPHWYSVDAVKVLSHGVNE